MSDTPAALPLSLIGSRELEPPPAALTPESFAELLYLALAPAAKPDPEVGWSLLKLCNGIGQMFQLIDELVRDSPEGPGWSILMDLDRCPAEALPWLAQFVGVRIPSGLSEAQQRAWVGSTDGFKRGTRAALIGAAAATLTGAQTVIFRERSGDPAIKPDYAYYLDVTTYDSQTPSPAATQAALLAQKPGGIVLRYHHAPGQDYQLLHERHASYAAVKASYANYDAVRRDQPA